MHRTAILTPLCPPSPSPPRDWANSPVIFDWPPRSALGNEFAQQTRRSHCVLVCAPASPPPLLLASGPYDLPYHPSADTRDAPHIAPPSHRASSFDRLSSIFPEPASRLQSRKSTRQNRRPTRVSHLHTLIRLSSTLPQSLLVAQPMAWYAHLSSLHGITPRRSMRTTVHSIPDVPRAPSRSSRGSILESQLIKGDEALTLTRSSAECTIYTSIATPATATRTAAAIRRTRTDLAVVPSHILA
ncbi:hypothetical protein B0H34DRAFT_795458 [Crassisporium funariophilum]|nr:hypothetical protein B0H34DRAFT_795458 [Crassisporium funariophilum]